MGFKHFNRQLVFRLILLLGLPLLIGYLIPNGKSWVLIFFLTLALCLLLGELVHFLNKTNRQIIFFIQAIKNDDTTLRFPTRTGNAIINELHRSLNELNIVLQKAKLNNQIRERYFSEILQNIGTGVMVINENGFVIDVNPAALEIFNLQTLTHLKQLDRLDPRFRAELQESSHTNKQVISLKKGNDSVQLIVRCSLINLKEEDLKLITLQDIRGELERKELDSWVKLIRVLSHEIMNSLAPVTSIAQSLKSIWKEKIELVPELSNDEAIGSTIGGLEVIGERGEGIIRFVQSYRMLTKVPVPVCTDVSLQALFERLSILVSPMKTEYKVAIVFHPPKPDFTIWVDEQMMAQVVINLVKNSAEALFEAKSPLIEVSARKMHDGHTEIWVSDNGAGIPEEIAEEIFVPFFTTKKDGAGIGLSYSRQILWAHGGTISCYSEKGKTEFRLIF